MADIEYELKFETTRDALRALGREPWLRRMQAGKTVCRQHRAVYFDTPDLALHARGACLRVRRESGVYVQCVKAPSECGAAAIARREWQGQVAGWEPDRECLEASGAGHVLPRRQFARLQAVFESRVRRTIRRLVTDGGAVVELASDFGEVLVGDRSTPVMELELELVSGDPQELLALAQIILDTVPARYSRVAKSDRGYSLLRADAKPWHRAPALALCPDQTTEEAFVAILLNALAHLRSNERCVLDRAHSEGVHQMRVAARRMRCALSIYRKTLPASQYTHFNQELRWLLHALGATRDWDVFLDETLRPVANAIPQDQSLCELRKYAEAQRDSCYAASQNAIRSGRYARLLLELGFWIQARGWREQHVSSSAVLLFEPVTVFAGRVLDRRLRRVRKRGKGFRNLVDERFHDVRIELKKLRYATEFFSTLYTKKAVRRFVRLLRALQDDMGKINDVAVARELVKGLIAHAGGESRLNVEYAAGLVIGWHTRGIGLADGGVRKLWRGFVNAPRFW